MNEMDPEPALSSRPSSEANVENEKAVPMTKNTRQNTAATTTGPEVVDTTPFGRHTVVRSSRDAYCEQTSVEASSRTGLVPVFVVFIGTPSGK